MTGSGFFDPATGREFRNWFDIEQALGPERGLALVEHGNTLDLFAAAMAWLSLREHRPGWLERRESLWPRLGVWLAVDGVRFCWSYAGRIAVAAE